MVLLGEGEFAFDVRKAIKVAKENIKDLHLEILKNTSHLIAISLPEITNAKIIQFLEKNV